VPRLCRRALAAQPSFCLDNERRSALYLGPKIIGVFALSYSSSYSLLLLPPPTPSSYSLLLLPPPTPSSYSLLHLRDIFPSAGGGLG
jgi:hypothetical protein